VEEAQIVQKTTNLTPLNPKKSIGTAIIAIFLQKN
jgi:hypothetical protein